MVRISSDFWQGRPFARPCHCLCRWRFQCYRRLSQYVADEEVKLVGVEAVGRGLDRPARSYHDQGKCWSSGQHEDLRYLAEDGQVAPVYPFQQAWLSWVGPETCFLWRSGLSRIRGSDRWWSCGCLPLFWQKEGNLPAIESSHAIAGHHELRNCRPISYHYQCIWTWRQGWQPLPTI